MFNKIIISLIVLIYSGAYMSLHSTKIDTLTHYVKKSNVVYYKKDVNEYLTRFIPNGEFEISSVTVYLEGKRGETVSLKIYEGELGKLFPESQKSVKITQNITKKIDGFEKINVYYEDKILVSKKEFFIAVSKECGQQVYLASDNIEKIPFCYIDSLNSISDQILLDCNNRYISGKYSFFVEVLGTYTNDETTQAFQRKFNCFDGSDFISGNQSITCLDINNDNKNDIVINGKIYLNKKDLEFELQESEEIIRMFLD